MLTQEVAICVLKKMVVIHDQCTLIYIKQVLLETASILYSCSLYTNLYSNISLSPIAPPTSSDKPSPLRAL